MCGLYCAQVVTAVARSFTAATVCTTRTIVLLHFLCVCGSWQKQYHVTGPGASCSIARPALVHEYMLDSSFQIPELCFTVPQIMV